MVFDVSLTSCPNCRAAKLIVRKGETQSVLRCQKCSDEFLFEGDIGRFVRMFDDYWENYQKICADDLEVAKTPSIVKERYGHFIAQRAKGTVCDLGCGDGTIIESLPHAEMKIAVDIAAPYLERLGGSIMKIWSEIENVPLRDHSVDTVVCSNVLEHVIDAERLASEIVRLVKPWGRILLAFPWEQDLGVYELEEYKVKYQKYKYVHLRSIDAGLISALFPEHQVVVEELITDGMEFMEFKPYPVKVMELAAVASKYVP